MVPCIQDENKNAQLTVLTDRSQGGASIIDGSVELMVSVCLMFLGYLKVINGNQTINVLRVNL